MTGDGPDRTVGLLARLLLRRLREREAAPEAGLTVGELHRELLPYPRCREAAGLASKAEYDLAMLELLAEPALLSAEDPELVEAVEEERASMEPELGLLEAFSEVTLRPGPALEVRAATSGPDTEADQRSPRCGDCGEPLEAGWRYCPSCGREAGG